MNESNYKIGISVVAPLFNEEGSLKQLYTELIFALEPLKNYEIIFINDGSRDNSKSILDELQIINKEQVKTIHFKNNLGKAMALQAGFDLAAGKIIITLDADLQDDPKEIPRFIQKINDGYDVVSGRKFHRLDSFIKNNTSKIYNYITSLVSGIWLHDHNCGFKAYRASAIKGIKLYSQLHRYIPVLVAVNGFERITEININHRKRIFGETKYGWTRFFWGIIGLLHVIIITNGQAIHLLRKNKFKKYGKH